MKSRVLLVAILCGVALIAVDAFTASKTDAIMRIAIDEAQALDRSLRTYHERHGEFPDAWSSPGIEPATLEPLRRRGYYDGAITRVLLDGRIDDYHSPDGVQRNQEFWLEMTLAHDPSIRLLLARSDDAPLGAGRWLDGVYLYRAGRLDKI